MAVTAGRTYTPKRLDLDWHKDAKCVGRDPNIFFPAKGYPAAGAMAICHNCPARDRCLSYALDAGERDGVWGETTREERKTLRAERRAARR